MQEINAFNLDKFNLKFDYCIIGSGISGILLANELSKKNKKILIIESGKFELDEKLQKLNEVINIGYPQRKNFKNRIRQIGGAGNLWPGRSLILNKIDLEKRDWIENSGWPIEYDEIERYYNKLKNYNMFDYEYFKQKDIISDKDDELYKAIFNNEDFDSIVAGWAKKVFRVNKKSKIYNSLRHNKNITLLYNLTAKKFIFDNHQVKFLEVVNEKSSFLVYANKYILATGGVENARILLSSQLKNDNIGRFFMDHPSYVRKNIKLLKPIKYSSMFEKVLKNARFKNGIRFNEKYQKQYKLTNNYLEFSPQYPESYEKTYSMLIQAAKIALKKGDVKKTRFDFKDINFTKLPEIIYLLRPSELMPHWINRNYYLFNKIINRNINATHLVISHHLEQVPDKESKIMLDKETNFLGIEKIKLHWKINDLEIYTAKLLEEKVLNQLKQFGFIEKNVKVSGFEKFNDASHHIGTTRMAENKKNGVVDKNCQVFGVNNLFIAGSSVFSTSGNANPTYTIAALTLRLADYLKENDE